MVDKTSKSTKTRVESNIMTESEYHRPIKDKATLRKENAAKYPKKMKCPDCGRSELAYLKPATDPADDVAEIFCNNCKGTKNKDIGKQPQEA